MRKDHALSKETNGEGPPGPGRLAPAAEEGDGAPTDHPPPAGRTVSPAPHQAPLQETRPADGLWWAAGVLFAHRRLLLGLTFLVGVLAVIISLMLPVWYRAETRVLLPESGSTSMLGLLDQVAPGASAILGGSGGEYTRYLSILTSRTLLGRAVERFDLEAVYETTERPDSHGDAITMLMRNFEFEVALDFDYLALRVYDRSPERAAALANFMVEALNEDNIRLTSSSARQNREFIGRRLDETQAALDSVKTELQAFQEQYGVLNVEQQGQAFFEALAQQRAAVAQLEVQYGALRQQYGDDNPQAQAARDALRAARTAEARFLSGGDALMPVPLGALPEVSRRYADLYQEAVTQAKIVEFILPLYEQARFDEEREAQAVQVLDEAVPPVRKAKPKRAIVVLATTLTAFLLLCAFLLARAWWRVHAHEVARRLWRAAPRPS